MNSPMELMEIKDLKKTIPSGESGLLPKDKTGSSHR